MLAYLRAGKVELRSRKDLDWTDKFPEIAGTLSHLAVDEAVLDGEIVHYNEDGVTNFSALQNDLAERNTAGPVYLAFDRLSFPAGGRKGLPPPAGRAPPRPLLAADRAA